MLTNNPNRFFRENGRANLSPSYSFKYDPRENFYDQDKTRVQALISKDKLNPALVTFDDQKKEIKFYHLNLIEINSIFMLGPNGVDKQQMTIFKLQNRSTLDMQQELDNQYKATLDMLSNENKIYSKTYSHLPDTKKTININPEQPLSLRGAINTIETNKKDKCRDLVLSEDHGSSQSKRVVLGSIELLQERKGVVMLEHLCDESMQAELDNCVAARVLSPALSAYLKKIDSMHHQNDTSFTGYFPLVKALVENGIKICALDSQPLYEQESQDDHADKVTDQRQLANIAWKEKYNVVRQNNPDSLIISIVGYGHTSQYLERKGLLAGVNPFDRLIGGECWNIDHNPHQILSRDKKNTITLDFNNFEKEKSYSRKVSHNLTDVNYFKMEILKGSPFVLRKEEEAGWSEKIEKYVFNKDAQDGKLLIGRVPVDMMKGFCERFKLTDQDIQCDSSSYPGPTGQIKHVTLFLKREGLDKMLKTDIKELREKWDETRKELLSMYSPTPSHSLKR